MRPLVARAVPLLAVVTVGATLCGCGLHDPYTGHHQDGLLPTATTSLGPVVAPVVPSSVPQAGDRGASPPAVRLHEPPTRRELARVTASPKRIASAFALACATVTLRSIGRRQSTLHALSTPGLARRLGTRAAARARAVRGLGADGRLTASLQDLALTADGKDQRHAVLTLAQKLTRARSGERPVSSTYILSLVHTAQGWRVDAFTVEP